MVKFEVFVVGYWLLVLFDLIIIRLEICLVKMVDFEMDFVLNVFSLFFGVKEFYIYLLKFNIIFIIIVWYLFN